MAWLSEEKVIKRIQDCYKFKNKVLTFDSMTYELCQLKTRLFEYEIHAGDHVFGMDNEPIFERQYYWPSEQYMVVKPGIFDRTRLQSDQSHPHSY